MPVIHPQDLPVLTGSSYPAPYAALVSGRSYVRVGEVGGLTQFGANIAILAPGAMSSCCHEHAAEDEFVMVTMGECVLVTDSGEFPMKAGDCAAFPAGSGEYHHLVNRTDAEARFLVVGSKAANEQITYHGDIDMIFERKDGAGRYLHRDGTPWDTK